MARQADQGSKRRGVDDVLRAGSPTHPRHKHMMAVDNAPKVDVHHPMEIVAGRIPRRAEWTQGDPRIVDQYLDRTEPVVRCVRQCGYAIELGYVRCISQCFDSECLDL